MELQIKDATFIYGEGTVFNKTALDKVNFTINQDDFTAIIGHTGSGKSTLIQHLNGLLKPTMGEVLVDGENIYKDKKMLVNLRQKVGLLFQYPEYQLFETTVFKDVSFGPSNLKLSESEIEKRVRNALDAVGIAEDDFLKSPFELSGGQRRRVAMAGVLALEPQILILDEPIAGLDPKGREEFLQRILKMHEKLKIAIVLVSHNMDDVAKLAKKVVVISKGEIVLQGTVKEVFKEVDLLSSIGLMAPSTSYLMKALKEKGFDVPLDVYTVEEAIEVIKKILRDRGKNGE